MGLAWFQDKQAWDAQTDSPTSTRPGFRLQCQAAAVFDWDLTHIDLKTAFLQGVQFDSTRDLACQLPPEAGRPPYTAARLKRAAYGLNDAPRLWWNRLDASLRSYGLVPTRADGCCYVLYSSSTARVAQPASSVWEAKWFGRAPSKSSMRSSVRSGESAKSSLGPPSFDLDGALELLSDPITGSPAHGRKVEGVVTIHVDDSLLCGTAQFTKKVLDALRRDFKVGSEDKNDLLFVGQRLRWIDKGTSNAHIEVDQEAKIEELSEIVVNTSLRDDVSCDPQMHKQCRSLLGQINWLQSRTQFQSCYLFSRCASAAASPTVGDVKALNKVARKNQS